MSYDDWYPPHLDGPEWVVPQPADCPGCPCEAAAVAADTPHATRTVAITVAGIARTVTAQAPTVGIGAGLLLAPPLFAATGGHLDAPVAVPMVLTAAAEDTPAELIAVDEHGTRWQIRLTASWGGAEVTIQDWHAN